MRKGDKVKVNAEVQTAYHTDNWKIIYEPNPKLTNPKSLYRRKCELKGIVIGYSFLSTGSGYPGRGDWNDWDPAYLIPDKRFKVWVVEPLIKDPNRYYKPIRCLEEDLEVLPLLEGTLPAVNGELEPSKKKQYLAKW